MNHAVKRKLIVFSALAIVLVLAAVFSRQLCPYDPYYQNYDAVLEAPGRAHPFGTDQFGRDMLSRVLAGSTVSIFSALILVGVISAAGTAVGVVSGYFGKAADGILMRISDVCQAFPGLVFALAIAAVLNGGIGSAVLALAVVSWPKYARIARSQTLSVKSSDYIASARLAGCRPMQVIFRHVLPNIAGQILVTAVLDIGTMMMEIAGLSFLGLGAEPPMAEWGSMMSQGRSMLLLYPWVVLTPGIGIFVSVAVFNLLGDAVRDCMDPRSAGRKQEAENDKKNHSASSDSGVSGRFPVRMRRKPGGGGGTERGE